MSTSSTRRPRAARRALFLAGLIVGLGCIGPRVAHAARSVAVDLVWAAGPPPGSAPRAYPLSAAPRAGLAAPAQTGQLRYAALPLGRGRAIDVAVDVGTAPPALWVDEDGDGQLTRAERTSMEADGSGFTARISVHVAFDAKTTFTRAEVEFRFLPRAQQTPQILALAHAFRSTTVRIDRRLRRVALVDGNGDLCFDHPQHDYLLVDHDANGELDGTRGAVERTPISERVRIGQRAYTIHVSGPAGARLRLTPTRGSGGALRRWGVVRDATEALERAKSDDLQKRLAALTALRHLRHPAAHDLAIELVRRSGLKTRDRALIVAVLSEHGDDDAVGALLALYQGVGVAGDVRATIVRSLRRVRDASATRRFIELLSSPSRRLQVVATRLLAGRSDLSAVKALAAQGARETDPRVLDAIIDALSERPTPAAATFLIAAAKQGSPRRHVIVSALGRIGFGVAEVRAFFRTLLFSKSVPELLLALDLVAGSEDVNFCPRVAPALMHTSWEIRHAAIRAMVALRCVNSIDALVARLEREPRRRLRVEIGHALFSLTGVYFYEDAERWAAWWQKEQQGFRVTAEAHVLPSAGQGGTTAGFYGLSLDSDHVIFVIDRSGSMAAPADPSSSTSRWAIAKREVTRAVRSLGRRGEAGVLLFSSDVRAWMPRLRRMGGGSRKALDRFLAEAPPEGGTNLYDALERAYTYTGADTIFIVSDGVPSAGRYRTARQVLRAVRTLSAGRRMRIHCVSVGMTSSLLKQIATEAGGRYVER